MSRTDKSSDETFGDTGPKWKFEKRWEDHKHWYIVLVLQCREFNDNYRQYNMFWKNSNGQFTWGKKPTNK
jgi:hypothetical protein